MNMDEDEQYLWKQRHEVLYRAQLSVLYHQRRERFFDLLDKGSKAVSLVGGSAAIARLGNPDDILLIAAAITVTSALSLVLGFGERARRHSELSRSFKLVETEVHGKGERGYSEEDIGAWRAKISTIEAAEPAALGALLVACQNDLLTAYGQTGRTVPLPWYKRLTMNLVNWGLPA